MEIIYPRNTRDDGSSGGVIGEGGIVENSTINQAFYDFLTQYFSEDNSKTIIETINNNYAEMPDIGITEMLILYMQKFETELKRITEAVENMDLGDKFVENHTVIDKGSFTWNDYTTNIYMLSGGVPTSITINQYINNICGVAIFGSEFTSLDASTGLLSISLYPVEYIEKLLANNAILTIGVDKYIPLTICEIQINDNELGDQIPDIGETKDNTSETEIETPYGFLYNFPVVEDVRNISSSDDWHVPEKYNEMNPIVIYIGGATDGNKLKSIGLDYWNDSLGTDDYNLGMRGSGYRSGILGTFSGIKELTRIRSDYALTLALQSDSGAIITANANDKDGCSVRLCKTAVGVADGEETIYVGNNGKSYRAVCIDEVYWTDNLSEDKWRDGTYIENVTDNAAWIALVTSAFCVYDNAVYLETTNGGIAVVDGNDYSLFEIDPDSGLNEPKKVSELDSSFLSSLLLRKI